MCQNWKLNICFYFPLCIADIPHSLTDEAIAKKDGLSLEGGTGGKKVQTHTFTNFPDSHDDDDEEKEDKSDVSLKAVCVKKENLDFFPISCSFSKNTKEASDLGGIILLTLRNAHRDVVEALKFKCPNLILDPARRYV